MRPPATNDGTHSGLVMCGIRLQRTGRQVVETNKLQGNCLGAVQGLKDQNSKGMMKHHQARAARPESENSTQFRWVSGAIEPMKMGGVSEMLRVREAEKAENAMHLICWGPR
ncbi:hypothetical protein Peur_025739 [Populus x canadensis]